MQRTALALILILSAGAAGAQEQDAPTVQPVEDPVTLEARSAFTRGAELVNQSLWPDALASFERSARLSPHAITTFNIGICLRAMGQYTRGRATFERALAEDDAHDRLQLAESLRAQAQAFMTEIDALLARVTVVLRPRKARLAIDGRPLLRAPDGATWLAGVRDPGTGDAIGLSRFVVLVDPGAHVFTVTRKGHRTIGVPRTFEAGEVTTVRLELDRLPATMRISADREDAIVSVGGRDLGPVPVDVERRAGRYRVLIEKDGFVPYETTVTVQPGADIDIRGKLPIAPPGIAERWWFWVGLGGAAATIAVSSYFIFRPDPEREPVNGGTLGWAVDVR